MWKWTVIPLVMWCARDVESMLAVAAGALAVALLTGHEWRHPATAFAPRPGSSALATRSEERRVSARATETVSPFEPSTTTAASAPGAAATHIVGFQPRPSSESRQRLLKDMHRDMNANRLRQYEANSLAAEMPAPRHAADGHGGAE